jgi:NADH dehydrogenase FAD-containing subunit
VTRARVVVAGLGDTGLLTARHLSRHVDVVGISTKPALVSGQELGMRLARPDEWAREYLVDFDRYRKLDNVRTIHGTLTGLFLADRTVGVRLPDGTTRTEPYDVLVIATGVTNGFWRRPDLQSDAEVTTALRAAHEQLAAAESINVIGGGAAAVSAAANLALVWPDSRVALYYPGDRALPQHHGRVWARVSGILTQRGVSLHPGHRATVPPDFDLDRITNGPVAFSTGQPDAPADATLWAIGRVRPNTDWLPETLLDEAGFVRVSPELSVSGAPGVFAIGDVAATDPLRGSARNRADRLLADNIRRHLAGRSLRSYRPRRRRWGSVLGYQPDGLRVFTPTGRSFRMPAWSIHTILQSWIVRRGIYGGVRASERGRIVSTAVGGEEHGLAGGGALDQPQG